MKRVQKADKACLQSSGWKLIKDQHTGVLKCEGRIKGYGPTYLPGGPLAEELVVLIHNQVMHCGTVNTMVGVRESWWIPKLRAKLKRVIKECNVFKVSPPNHTEYHRQAPCQYTEQREADRLR